MDNTIKKIKIKDKSLQTNLIRNVALQSGEGVNCMDYDNHSKHLFCGTQNGMLKILDVK